MHYTPLNGERSTRVLIILPADPRNERVITTKLSIISLSSNLDVRPRYDALSYVWGDTNDRIPIKCNGEDLKITPSLHIALLQLRQGKEEHDIWIDQICINQDDVRERQQQVSLMREIYTLAERVIVWLGPADNDTPLVWSLLKELRKLRDFKAPEVYHLARSESRSLGSGIFDQSNHSQTSSSANIGSKSLPDLPPGAALEWKAMERFFKRPWFTRMWTFQEVVLSRDCTVYCGNYWILWSALSDACKGIDKAGYDIYLDQIHGGVAAIQRQRLVLGNGIRSALRNLLEDNRTRKATEPKDMIYALRGLIDGDIAESIDVNYEEQLGVTYAKAVKLCIEQSAALTILGSVEYRRTAESTKQMPSWVPDWRYATSVAVDLSMRDLEGNTYFNASNREPSCTVDNIDIRKLTLRGFTLAKLTSFSDVKTWLEFGIYRMGSRTFQAERFQLGKWQSMYKRAAKQIEFAKPTFKQQEHADQIMASLWHKSIHDPLSEDESLEMAYRRTITADLLPRPKNSRLSESETTGGFPAYASWQTAGFPVPVPPEVLHEYDFYVTQVMSNREFFIAESGTDAYMGITMGIPTDGDCVCILLGGDTPFVLRPKSDGEWQFLAEAYVHGIMDGEAMESTRQAGFEYETFVLA